MQAVSFMSHVGQFPAVLSTGRAVLSFPAEQVVAILKSKCSQAPDPRLEEVLEEFRRYFLKFGRAKYPTRPREDIEDAAQNALMKLVDAKRLGQIRDDACIVGWARRVFTNAIHDLIGGPMPQREPPQDPPREDRTPEDEALWRERLRIIRKFVENLKEKAKEVAILKLFEELSEKEIVTRTGLTRDQVAQLIKRLRKRLRAVLEEREGTRA
jgi:RNA polymerase sigma-70 factor (ECF subfamily)